MGNSIRSRNVERGFPIQTPRDLVFDVQTAMIEPIQVNPVQVAIPIRRKTAQEFQDDVNNDKVFGLYDVTEPCTEERDEGNTGDPSASIIPIPYRSREFYGSADLNYREGDQAEGRFLGQGFFMQPRLVPNVCLRCTDAFDKTVCPSTRFMDGARDIWELAGRDVDRLKEMKLRFSSLLEFATAARKADQIYLLNAQNKFSWFDRTDGTNTEFIEGVIGLLSFANRSDMYGKMTFYRYRRCAIGARVDRLQRDLSGMPTRHAMLLKFST
jgi:hypothetical protein